MYIRQSTIATASRTQRGRVTIVSLIECSREAVSLVKMRHSRQCRAALSRGSRYVHKACATLCELRPHHPPRIFLHLKFLHSNHNSSLQLNRTTTETSEQHQHRDISASSVLIRYCVSFFFVRYCKALAPKVLDEAERLQSLRSHFSLSPQSQIQVRNDGFPPAVLLSGSRGDSIPV